MKRRLGHLTICALGLIPWCAEPGFAHAFLDHADPKVGSAVDASPPALTLTFTKGVEPAFSRIEVFDPDGKALATGKLEHPADDALRMTLPPLAAGKYRVHWSVVSVDTHTTEGRFDFSVRGK